VIGSLLALFDWPRLAVTPYIEGVVQKGYMFLNIFLKPKKPTKLCIGWLCFFVELRVNLNTILVCGTNKYDV